MALFISVRPAAAQNKVEIAAGYQFLRFIETGGENVPAGWGASIAGGKSDKMKLVADIGGHYKDGNKIHTFQGGVEFAGKNAKTTPFVRVLAGLGHHSGGGESDNAFVVTPEVGVKFFGKGKFGGRIAAGFPIFRESGDTTKTFRLFVGIVCK